MLEILMERVSSLVGLKEEIHQVLKNLDEDQKRMKFEDKEKIDEFRQASESLERIVGVYIVTLSTFLDEQKGKFTYREYQTSMKAYDDELRVALNTYVFLKSELAETV